MVDQNTLRRQGTGLIASAPAAVSPGYTLFTPLASWRDVRGGGSRVLIVAAMLGQPGTDETILPNTLGAGRHLMLGLGQALQPGSRRRPRHTDNPPLREHGQPAADGTQAAQHGPEPTRLHGGRLRGCSASAVVTGLGATAGQPPNKRGKRIGEDASAFMALGRPSVGLVY